MTEQTNERLEEARGTRAMNWAKAQGMATNTGYLELNLVGKKFGGIYQFMEAFAAAAAIPSEPSPEIDAAFEGMATDAEYQAEARNLAGEGAANNQSAGGSLSVATPSPQEPEPSPAEHQLAVVLLDMLNEDKIALARIHLRAYLEKYKPEPSPRPEPRCGVSTEFLTRNGCLLQYADFGAMPEETKRLLDTCCERLGFIKPEGQKGGTSEH